jgi:repressor LexA
MSDSDMAKRIKELRLSLGLTLEEVANQVGVGKSTVRKWETGIIANMKRDKIAALAKALHTTPGYLMGWTDEQAISPVSKSICKQIEDKFGKNAATALSLYVQLDEIDQVRITERMTVLLEDEKYSSKTKNGASPA